MTSFHCFASRSLGGVTTAPGHDAMRVLTITVLAVGAMLAIPAGASNRIVSQHAPAFCLGDNAGKAVLGSCSDSIADFSGYGEIRNQGRCLTSHNKGQALTWSECTGQRSPSPQKWQVQRNAQLNAESGWCADVQGQGSEEGTPVIAWDCPKPRLAAAPTNQKWTATTQSAVPVAASVTTRATTLQDVNLVLRNGGKRMTLAQALDLVARSKGGITMDQVLKVISNDGGSVISNDGGSFRVMANGQLISQDGAGFHIVNGVISNDGGSLIGSGGNTLVGNSGGTLTNNIAAGIASQGPRSYQAASTGATCTTAWVSLLLDTIGRQGSGNTGYCDSSRYTGKNTSTGKMKWETELTDAEKAKVYAKASDQQFQTQVLAALTAASPAPAAPAAPAAPSQADKDKALAAYKSEYYVAESALKAAFPGSPSKLDPVSQIRNGVWVIDPALAVKHFADVDLPKLGNVAPVTYLTSISHPKNGDVAGWYASNYGLTGGMTAQPMNAYDAKYAGAEAALKKAFPGSDAKLARSAPKYVSGQWVVEPAPAVKHAAEVDEPVQGKGDALFNYLRRTNDPKNGNVAAWYMTNFQLTGGAVAGSTVIAQAPSPAPVAAPSPNLLTDAHNCGRLGNVCTSGVCVSGACSAPQSNVLASAPPIPAQPVVVAAPAGANCSNPTLTVALKANGRGTAADTGSSGLCNPSRYRGADRNPAALNVNQPEINDLVKQSFYCQDPWIGEIWAEREQNYRQLSSAQQLCNIKLYNNGSWNGWDQLRQFIQDYHRKNPNA